MNQTFSWSAFATGLTTFIGISSEMITVHTQWSDFKTPYGVFHCFLLGVAFAGMIAGALGVQLPRKVSHNERQSDPKE